MRRTKENISGKKNTYNLEGCHRTNVWPICWIFDTCFDSFSSKKSREFILGHFTKLVEVIRSPTVPVYFEIDWNLSSQIYCDLPAQACFLQELLTPENIEPFWVMILTLRGRQQCSDLNKKIDQVGEIRLTSLNKITCDRILKRKALAKHSPIHPPPFWDEVIWLQI